MDNETRHLETSGTARAPGAATPPAAENGTPTAFLPPLPQASAAARPTPPPAGSPPPAGYYSPPPATGNGTGPAYALPAAYPAAPPPAGAQGGRGPGAWARPGNDRLLPLLLIGAGLIALGGGFRYVFGAAFPLALGLIFLYVSNQGPHRWGFRIPGCILTGLGAGVMIDSLGSFGHGGYSAVGLGLGFLALWLFDRAQWWWLIPAAAVGLGGLQGVFSSSATSSNILLPIALIALGIYAFSGRRWRRHV